MSGQFSMHIMVSFFAGIILAFPYIFYQFWSFISPALYDNERKHSKGAVFFSSLLFLAGVLFGFFIITPLSVHFLGGYHVSGQVTNQINLNSYVGTVVSCVLASGVIFELPIVVFFLSKAGIVYPEAMKKYRKHSIVAILCLAAIITPPDIFSQLLVCLPLVLLYEASIFISRSVQRKREEEMA
jgi:sec-independent protein translocase protein TatC